MMYIEDTCGELWSISVIGDIKQSEPPRTVFPFLSHTKEPGSKGLKDAKQTAVCCNRSAETK